MFKFLNYQIFSRRSGQSNKCPSPYKFHENQSNDWWDIALTIVKMAALCYLGFLKISIFFEQLVSSGELICVIVQNFSKIVQTVLEILQFFDFQDGCRPSSWILKFLNFWSTVQLGGPMCIAIPNFIKIGQAVAEIWHLTIFKIAATAILDF